MTVVNRHRAAGTTEDGGLVHVVPHAVDARSHIVLVERGPPSTHLLAGKVGEMAGTRPDIAYIWLALAVFHPIVASGALIVDEIARLYFHARVYHVDRLEVLLVQIVVQALGVGELFGMEGENLVGVHIVDVHPDDIGRDTMLAQQVGNLFNSRIRMITEAALLIAKRPQRR